MTSTDKAQLTKLAQAMLEASGAAGICGPIPGTDNFIVIGNQEWIDRQASAGVATTAASAVPANIKTWRERLPDDSGVLYNYAHVCAMKAEIADLRAAISAAPPAALSEKAEPQWISVDDRLPPKYEEVIVFPQPTDYTMTAELYGESASGNPVWKYGEYQNGWGHEWIEITYKVTHWMHKPTDPATTKDQAASKGEQAAEKGGATGEVNP